MQRSAVLYTTVRRLWERSYERSGGEHLGEKQDASHQQLRAHRLKHENEHEEEHEHEQRPSIKIIIIIIIITIFGTWQSIRQSIFRAAEGRGCCETLTAETPRFAPPAHPRWGVMRAAGRMWKRKSDGRIPAAVLVVNFPYGA
jgi:hypothetical protein